jgi:tetratricopeptide (TPR) repeat protein
LPRRNAYYALWLTNSGRWQEAIAPVQAARTLAERINSPLLIGLAGLAQGWIEFGQGNYPAAIEVLEAACDLGPDPHQQHFIHMYIGLTQFALNNLTAAADQWARAMRGSLAVGNVRGAAGSVEGCAYIAERMGDHPRAARFLAVAARIRDRTATPLFDFWTPYHDASLSSARRHLGSQGYTASVAAARTCAKKTCSTKPARSSRTTQHAQRAACPVENRAAGS